MNVNRRHAIIAGLVGILPLPFMRRAVGSQLRQGKYTRVLDEPIEQKVERMFRSICHEQPHAILFGRGWFGFRYYSGVEVYCNFDPDEVGSYERHREIAIHLTKAFEAHHAELANSSPKRYFMIA